MRLVLLLVLLRAPGLVVALKKSTKKPVVVDDQVAAVNAFYVLGPFATSKDEVEGDPLEKQPGGVAAQPGSQVV